MTTGVEPAPAVPRKSLRQGNWPGQVNKEVAASFPLGVGEIYPGVPLYRFRSEDERAVAGKLLRTAEISSMFNHTSPVWWRTRVMEATRVYPVLAPEPWAIMNVKSTAVNACRGKLYKPAWVWRETDVLKWKEEVGL